MAGKLHTNSRFIKRVEDWTNEVYNGIRFVFHKLGHYRSALGLNWSSTTGLTYTSSIGLNYASTTGYNLENITGKSFTSINMNPAPPILDSLLIAPVVQLASGKNMLQETTFSYSIWRSEESHNADLAVRVKDDSHHVAKNVMLGAKDDVTVVGGSEIEIGVAPLGQLTLDPSISLQENLVRIAKFDYPNLPVMMELSSSGINLTTGVAPVSIATETSSVKLQAGVSDFELSATSGLTINAQTATINGMMINLGQPPVSSPLPRTAIATPPLLAITDIDLLM